MTFLKKEEG